MGLLDTWTQSKAKTNSTSTTEQTKDPWAPATGGLMSGLDYTQNLFNNGVGGQVYNGKTVAKPGAETRAAWDQTMANANQGVPGLDGAFGFANGMIANNGMTGDMTRTAGYLDNFANGSYNEDPRLQQAIAARETRAADTAASYASGYGRYGSGGMGKTMGREVSNAGNELMLQSNENARNRQLQATGQLGSLYQQGANNAFQATGMLPGLNEMRYDGASRLAGVGAAKDAYSQSLINAKIAKFGAKQTAPWQMAQNFWQFPMAAAQLGGTATTNTTGTGTQTGTPSLLQDVAAVGGIIGSGYSSYKGVQPAKML